VRELPLTLSPSGLYCPAGDFHIDPWAAVDRAVVTHAHSDHLRIGSKHYLISREGLAVTRARLPADASIQTLEYCQAIDLNGVKVSLHPAGHVLGSAQVRVEHQGHVSVVSGDYKRHADATCTGFEVVRCHHFITEATFGLPIYQWQPPQVIAEDLNHWRASVNAEGRCAVLLAYSLGKAQRLIRMLDETAGPIVTHGSVETLVRAYRQTGVELPTTITVSELEKADIAKCVVIAPASAIGSPWMNRFGDYASAQASGWMTVRGMRRQRTVDRGFVLSDHVDWPGLIQTIRDTGATCIGVTHGYTAVVSRYLREIGLDAHEIQTRFTGDREDTEEAA
jgi:putative mRNA 3-end processing factor